MFPYLKEMEEATEAQKKRRRKEVRMRTGDEALGKKRSEKRVWQRARAAYAKEQVINNIENKKEGCPLQLVKKGEREKGPCGGG